ncbi:hypothetical protein F5879DRAFT_1033979 [Lentinula edodes]|nr:hypothetical protein F5879DRAFT_1033979 [Lentinula edodes]
MDSTLAYPYSSSNPRAGQGAPPPLTPQALPSFQNFFVHREGNATPLRTPTEQRHNTSSTNIRQRNLLIPHSPIFTLPHLDSLDRTPLTRSNFEELHQRNSPSPPPSPSPAVPSPSLTLVITTQAVDNLAKDFHCTEAQRSVLHTLVRFGSIGDGLSKADLSTRLLTLAVLFDMENQRPKEDENNLQTMRTMYKDLKIRLEQSFSLTSAQTKSIRLIAQEKIYDPLRTCYAGINRDVFDYIKTNAEVMHFSNIFGNPNYESTLEKAIKKASSSVRNAFRQHLRDGVEKGTDAATFTHSMNKVYIRMAGPSYNTHLLLLRNIVLRRFIFDNPNTLWAEEDPNQYDSAMDVNNPSPSASPQLNGESTISPPPPKKLRTVGGRVVKGQDFWSLVDAWFASKKELGKKLTDPGWKKLLEEYVQFDEDGFRKRPQQQPPHERAATSQADHNTGGLNARGSNTWDMLM